MWFAADHLDICVSYLQRQVAGPLLSDRQVSVIVYKCCCHFLPFIFYLRVFISDFDFIISPLPTSISLSSGMFWLHDPNSAPDTSGYCGNIMRQCCR